MDIRSVDLNLLVIFDAMARHRRSAAGVGSRLRGFRDRGNHPAAAEPGVRPEADDVCSWCGKPEADVKKLIGRSGTALCNECVALACDIMDAELGASWR